MAEQREEKPEYFRDALADFMHDAASGDAVRHLVDLGYTTNAILQRLDFPTPRERVEKAVYRRLIEKGVLLEELPVPEDSLRRIRLDVPRGPGEGQVRLMRILRGQIQDNEEEHSYAACPFGTIRRNREARLAAMLDCLTTRERDYLLGIPWPPRVIYHRLDSRMLEMAVCLATQPGREWRFYFLGKGETMAINAV